MFDAALRAAPSIVVVAFLELRFFSATFSELRMKQGDGYMRSLAEYRKREIEQTCACVENTNKRLAVE